MRDIACTVISKLVLLVLIISLTHFPPLNLALSLSVLPHSPFLSKSANILIREDGTAGLSDFGEAVDLQNTASVQKAVLVTGSSYYCSPEAIKGEASALKTASDIFSMGIVLLEAGAVCCERGALCVCCSVSHPHLTPNPIPSFAPTPSPLLDNPLQIDDKAYLGPSYLHSQKVDSTCVAFGGLDAPSPQEVKRKVAEGWRPDIPHALEYHHPKVASVIMRCLSEDQDERPSAVELLQILQDAEYDKAAIAKDLMISMDLAEEDKANLEDIRKLSIFIEENAMADPKLKASKDAVLKSLHAATGGISSEYGATAGMVRTSEGNLLGMVKCHVPCKVRDFAAVWNLEHLSETEYEEKMRKGRFHTEVQLANLSKHHHDFLGCIEMAWPLSPRHFFTRTSSRILRVRSDDGGHHLRFLYTIRPLSAHEVAFYDPPELPGTMEMEFRRYTVVEDLPTGGCRLTLLTLGLQMGGVIDPFLKLEAAQRAILVPAFKATFVRTATVHR